MILDLRNQSSNDKAMSVEGESREDDKVDARDDLILTFYVFSKLTKVEWSQLTSFI